MTTPNDGFSPGPLTQPRYRARSVVDAQSITEIIDGSLVAHVAYVGKSGVPQCLPMAFGRIEGTLYLHGAVANAHLAALVGGRCSVTFTLLDGLVMARSAYHHSMNYRCAVAIGTARLVTDPDEKVAALTAVLDHACPGRSKECIGMTDAELRGTKVVAIEVTEAVAKRRSGPPLDEAVDIDGDEVFAGVIDIELRATAVRRDPSMKRDHRVPNAVADFATRHGGSPIHEMRNGDLLFSSDPSRIDHAWLHAALSNESYWAKGISETRLRASVEHSLVFGVYATGRQVAFCRVLTDGARIGYIGDVFVEQARRGQGLGKTLVEFVLEHPLVRSCERLILATRDAQSLYARFGFEPPVHTYMVRRQTPA